MNSPCRCCSLWIGAHPFQTQPVWVAVTALRGSAPSLCVAVRLPLRAVRAVVDSSPIKELQYITKKKKNIHTNLLKFIEDELLRRILSAAASIQTVRNRVVVLNQSRPEPCPRLYALQYIFIYIYILYHAIYCSLLTHYIHVSALKTYIHMQDQPLFCIFDRVIFFVMI